MLLVKDNFLSTIEHVYWHYTIFVSALKSNDQFFVTVQQSTACIVYSYTVCIVKNIAIGSLWRVQVIFDGTKVSAERLISIPEFPLNGQLRIHRLSVSVT